MSLLFAKRAPHHSVVVEQVGGFLGRQPPSTQQHEIYYFSKLLQVYTYSLAFRVAGFCVCHVSIYGRRRWRQARRILTLSIETFSVGNRYLMDTTVSYIIVPDPLAVTGNSAAFRRFQVALPMNLNSNNMIICMLVVVVVF